MTQYKLKTGTQGFTVIDGPMAGRSFKAGIVYDAIPPQEAAKFEKIESAAVASDTAGKQKKDIK